MMVPASNKSHIRAGEPCYWRLRLRGYDVVGGVEYAIVQAIDKTGAYVDDTWQYCDPAQLIPAVTVKRETSCAAPAADAAISPSPTSTASGAESSGPANDVSAASSSATGAGPSTGSSAGSGGA